MKNKRVFSGVLLAVTGALFMLSIVGCDNATTTTTQYTVTFDANGGQVSPSAGMVEEGKTLSSLPTPTKESGEDTFFQGWYTKNGTNDDWGTPFTVLTPITTDITVYAKWGNTEPIKHTVTFNPDGGAVNPTGVWINSGDPVGSLPTPTKNSNTFEGWWTALNGGGTQFIETTMVTSDITVYAKWTAIARGQKTISVTGLSDYNGKRIEVLLTETQNTDSNDDLIAFYSDLSGPLIANGERKELPLYVGIDQPQPWTGSGSYYVEIIIRTPDSANYNEADFISKNKIAFVSTTTTIEFSPDDFNIDEPTAPNDMTDIFPDNWKTLDYAGWQTWFDNLDMTQGTREIIRQFLEQHFSEMTEGGQLFWEELIIESNETPEDYRGTWKKGNITLVIEASQLTISGANWNEINTTFRIESIRQKFDGSIQCYFPPYGINCKLQNESLIILEGSGPDELHGTWTSYQR
jgi:uncharacterized repeat protein (TIGR02543 family)